MYSLGGQDIVVADQYCYLGLELRPRLDWRLVKDMALAKARRVVDQIWSLGTRTARLPVDTLCRLYRTKVLPLLMYGAEVWGNQRWESAEALQRLMARRILQCPDRTSGAFLLSELGWLPLRAARDRARLLFWHKLEEMRRRQPRRIASRVLTAARLRAEEVEVPGTYWCAGTRAVLASLGLSAAWSSSTAVDKDHGLGTRAEWAHTVSVAIDAREQRAWLRDVDGSSSLAVYRSLKFRIQDRASYLDSWLSTGARKAIARLRCAANDLRSSCYRWKDGSSGPVCPMCLADREDEAHFLLDCPAYDRSRQELVAVVERHFEFGATWMDLSREQQLQHLLLSEWTVTETDRTDVENAVGKFVQTAMRRRRGADSVPAAAA